MDYAVLQELEIGCLVAPFGNVFRTNAPRLKDQIANKQLVGSFIRREPIAKLMLFENIFIYDANKVSYLVDHSPRGSGVGHLGNAAREFD